MNDYQPRITPYILGLIQDLLFDGRITRKLATPEMVRYLLPNSGFTKKGPGVKARKLKAFKLMTRDQQKIALERGWVPCTWKVKAA